MREIDQSDAQAETVWRLTERLKELTALHGAAKAMQDDAQEPSDLLRRVLDLLPAAWQHPRIAEARISVGDVVVATSGWRSTPWTQESLFRVSTGETGRVEVCYTEERPAAVEGPFLLEERALLDSVAEMLRRWFQHRAADRALADIRNGLERLVADRSADLSRSNEALRREVDEHRAARAAIERYQQQLRDMSNALRSAEERERRSIAQTLHDHIGQSLAFARMRLLDIRGNAVFCGFEDDISHVLRLLDGCLRYTRDLTCELSPPRLYELGLDAALEWLCESYRAQHKVGVVYEGTGDAAGLDDAGRAVLYAAARELLANAVRHGRPRKVAVSLRVAEGRVVLRVRDDGTGFDPGSNPSQTESGMGNRFGLFSIRERLGARRGALRLTSSPRGGTDVSAEIPLAAEGAS